MENMRLKMKKIDKPDESADSSSFGCLPDEIVLQILSRLIDLKTLCQCKLVSIRFNHIVQQVNAISVTITSIDRPSSAPSEGDLPVDFLLTCDSFVSVMKSLQTFSALKSLCIEIPPIHRAEYNDFLFKWKFNEPQCGTDSFLFLSPTSICDMKENVRDEEEQEEQNLEVSEMKLTNAIFCCEDCDAISSELRYYLKCFPLLENVTITDTGKRGRLSLCGQGTVRDNKRMRWCYVPLLKLPVTGYMMKGVFLVIFEMFDLPGDDSSVKMNWNDFEDKEEAVYSEAVMEIFKRNRGWKESYFNINFKRGISSSKFFLSRLRY